MPLLATDGCWTIHNTQVARYDPVADAIVVAWINSDKMADVAGAPLVGQYRILFVGVP